MPPENDESDRASRPQRASILSRRSSPHVPVDVYDHAIGLIDTTVAGGNNSNTNSGAQTPVQSAPGPDNDPQARRRDRVRASVRGEYNRQKWRRYQKERAGGDGGGGGGGGAEEDTDDDDNKDIEAGRVSKDTYGVSTIRRNYDWVRDKIPMRQKAKEKAKKKEEFAIDVLYENQRGLFFCGIPLYSHQSLLNFDPPAWQTRDFRDSVVNITNAQPPDPTWAWSWRCWYVDMSHDVDEEGWEYSLSFQQGFAWHGTHPWFHSFVRRRRWLRKRVKIKSRGGGTGAGKGRDALHESHKLNLDYFTIHSASREASSNRVPLVTDAASSSGYNQRYSVITSKSYLSDGDETDGVPEEINDITSLMKALKAATVDRKKLAIVRAFLDNAGAEVRYLPQQIPEIMDLFIYQTSRRQVVDELQQAAARESEDSHLAPTIASNTAQTDTDGAAGPPPSPLPSSAASRNPSGANTPTMTSTQDQARSLERAVEIAQQCIHPSEYWSDAKKTLANAEALDVPPPPPGDVDMAPTLDEHPSKRPAMAPRQKSEGVRIKGIPDAADVGQEAGIARRVTLEMRNRGGGNVQEQNQLQEADLTENLDTKGEEAQPTAHGGKDDGKDEPLEVVNAAPEDEGNGHEDVHDGDEGSDVDAVGADLDSEDDTVPASLPEDKGKGRERV